MLPQAALKYEAEVNEEGRVELALPYPPGAHVVIFVIESTDDALADLTLASQSSLGFWDNPLDDEDWNSA